MNRAIFPICFAIFWFKCCLTRTTEGPMACCAESHRHHDVNKNKAGGVAHAHDHTYAGMINVPVHSAQQTHQEHVKHDHAYIQKHTAQENTLADHTYAQLHQKIAKKHVKNITPLLKQITTPCPQTTPNNKRLHSATIETTTDANNNCETNHHAKKLCQHKVPQPNYFISIQSNEFAAYNVPGDGDCFFHCMTLATHHTLHESAHIHYRESICSHIYHNWQNFLHLLPLFHDTSMTKQAYLQQMVHGHGFATALEIGVAAHLLNANITVYLQGHTTRNGHQVTTFHQQCFNTPHPDSNTKTITLLLANTHYNFLLPTDNNRLSTSHDNTLQKQTASE